MHTIIGGVVSDNVASLRLHHARFRRSGPHCEVGFKPGRWLDLAFMQLVPTHPPIRWTAAASVSKLPFDPRVGNQPDHRDRRVDRVGNHG
jgi:hypothetical protein